MNELISHVRFFLSQLLTEPWFRVAKSSRPLISDLELFLDFNWSFPALFNRKVLSLIVHSFLSYQFVDFSTFASMLDFSSMPLPFVLKILEFLPNSEFLTDPFWLKTSSTSSIFFLENDSWVLKAGSRVDCSTMGPLALRSKIDLLLVSFTIAVTELISFPNPLITWEVALSNVSTLFRDSDLYSVPWVKNVFVCGFWPGFIFAGFRPPNKANFGSGGASSLAINYDLALLLFRSCFFFSSSEISLICCMPDEVTTILEFCWLSVWYIPESMFGDEYPLRSYRFWLGLVTKWNYE